MRTRVYLSFSYSEDEFRRELRDVLTSDVRLSDLFWDDSRLEPGEDFTTHMHQAVAETRVMIMLVSPRYLDKAKCQAWTYEIPPAIAAYRKQELKIMWVPARAIRVEDTPFPEIQAAHPLSQPLDTLSVADRQLAYKRIKQSILKELGLDKMDSFHVFLSHNSKDKPAVKQLGLELKERGLNPWLDEWELPPGIDWHDALEEIIKTCQSAAICVADNGIGPWEDPEMKALLRRFVNEKKSGKILPVIPVLLPGAPVPINLPAFLEQFTWVDLRSGLTKEVIDKLVWGITGRKPNP